MQPHWAPSHTHLNPGTTMAALGAARAESHGSRKRQPAGSRCLPAHRRHPGAWPPEQSKFLPPSRRAEVKLLTCQHSGAGQSPAWTRLRLKKVPHREGWLGQAPSPFICRGQPWGPKLTRSRVRSSSLSCRCVADKVPSCWFQSSEPRFWKLAPSPVGNWAQ